jgi:hypothetical protein
MTQPPESRLTGRAHQRGERVLPLVGTQRLPRSDVDPERAELRGARRLGRVRVDVDAIGDLESHEAGGDDRRPKLCLQQSAGDSALPQIDVAFRFVAEGLLHQDVAELQPPARLEHASHLLQPGELVREEIQHAVRDHDVRPTIKDRQ